MLVRARGLGHGFESEHELFRDLNFDISEGELVCVTGPSGSGKSTLLSILARWERPRSGTLEVADATQVAWVFQNPHGVAGRNAIDHVALAYLARGASRPKAEKEALQVMSTLNLLRVADKPFRALSGGEAQRLMMARAVATDPQLLLMDEPTAQLDAVNASEVLAVLSRLAGVGPGVVIATHDPRVRAACSQEISLLATV